MQYCEVVPEDSEWPMTRFNSATQLREAVDSSSEESDIEVIRQQSPTAVNHEHYQESTAMLNSWIVSANVASNEDHSSSQHDKVGPCERKANTITASEDFVLVDGYETDVESITSCDSTDDF